MNLALQSSAAPSGPASSQEMVSPHTAQQASNSSAAPQDFQLQGASAIPDRSVNAADAAFQARAAPSAGSQESPPAPEQMAVSLMQPSLSPAEAAGPLTEANLSAGPSAAPGDTVYNLAEFQVTFT